MQPNRLERKRELDRKAQRAARARNKQHIENLEDAVQRLSAELQAERSRNSITSTARITLPPAEPAHEYLQWQGATPHDLTIANTGDNFSIPVTPDFATEGEELPNHALQFGYPGSSMSFEPFMTPSAVTPGPSALLGTEMDFRHVLDCGPDENLFPLINSAIIVAERLGRYQILGKEATDQDILIRSSVQGWEGVQQRYGTIDIGWRLIQAFDNLFWRETRPLERVVLKAICRQVFVARTRNPIATEPQESSLPDYLVPTTSQRVIGNNSAVAHYIAWPSVRNMLTSDNLHYTRNFAQQFAKNFSFKWQYELRDVYMRSPETGAYTVSLQFLSAMRDLSNFMGRFDTGKLKSPV